MGLQSVAVCGCVCVRVCVHPLTPLPNCHDVPLRVRVPVYGRAGAELYRGKGRGILAVISANSLGVQDWGQPTASKPFPSSLVLEAMGTELGGGRRKRLEQEAGKV